MSTSEMSGILCRFLIYNVQRDCHISILLSHQYTEQRQVDDFPNTAERFFFFVSQRRLRISLSRSILSDSNFIHFDATSKYGSYKDFLL